MPFEDTPNKALIREAWDLPILVAQQARINRPLAYFGMCGTEMYDIRTWRSVIEMKCCIEAPGNTPEERRQLPIRMARMRSVAHANGLLKGFQPLTGLVEDIILTGLDRESKRPVLTDLSNNAEDTRFRYDLYNLDFDGGLGFTSKEQEIRRVDALGRLFDRQRGHDFTLLLTLNVRDTIRDVVDVFLASLSKRKYGDGWRELVDWHRAQGPKAYLLKAAVPLFIQRQAEARRFRPKCHPPIVYNGANSATLVHFAFELTHVTQQLSAVGEQEEVELLRLPLLRSEGGALAVISRDAPGFDAEQCARALVTLNDEQRRRAVAVETKQANRKQRESRGR